MSANERLLRLEIDYELTEEEKGKDDSSVPKVTRNLINIAFTSNYREGMDDKISRLWRNIRKSLDDAIDSKAGFVLFSVSDSETVYKEVYDCKYSPMLSRYAPYLYDELDVIKTRSPEDEKKIQEEYAALQAKVEEIQRNAGIPKTAVPLKPTLEEVG